jgi:S-methylmethionine-dependent homocysteine/selenocysteine methylase
MDLNFFKQTRILDGGMGQELLARGMKHRMERYGVLMQY